MKRFDRNLLAGLLFVSTAACGATATPVEAPNPEPSDGQVDDPESTTAGEPQSMAVPFRYVFGHILETQARIGDDEHRVVLDTGAGITLIDDDVCQQMGCRRVGVFSGQRMSGQTIEAALFQLPSLRLGPVVWEGEVVAVMDIDALIPNSGIAGVISLKSLRDQPFTIDYDAREIVFEDDAAIETRAANAISTPIELHYQREALDVFMRMQLPSGREISVEVDTGSDSLVLNESIVENAPLTEERVVEGEDETGHRYRRRFGTLPGRVALASDESIAASDVPVMVQEIIYDGLVGNDWLSRFNVTFDLPRRRMLFAPRREQGPSRE